MGLISSQQITVDAIITSRGRQLLSQNDGSFKITQFALSDDEIDYTLYNPDHPSGSAYYGEAIRDMPVTEAVPNDQLSLKYKLITLPKGTSKLPVVQIGTNIISLKQGSSITITPQTLNYGNTSSIYETSGYVATISDSRLVSVFNGVGIQVTQTSTTDQFANAKLSKSQIGTSFTITATNVDALFTNGQTKLVTTISIQGRDSGAQISIPLEIIKK